jgi:hypothetical protein
LQPGDGLTAFCAKMPSAPSLFGASVFPRKKETNSTLARPPKLRNSKVVGPGLWDLYLQWRFAMLGSLRLPLIVSLVLSPVTADLRHGLNWSEASAVPYCEPYQMTTYDPIFWQPWTYYTNYNPPVYQGLGCYQYQCVRRGLCVSEARTDPGGPVVTPTKISRGCLHTICIKTRAYRWF